MTAEPTITTEALYTAHWQFVFQLLASYGIFGHEQEDVAQTIWLHIHARIDTYDPARQTPRAWITGFVRRCVANYWRSRHRAPGIPITKASEGVAAPGLDPEERALLRTIEQAIPDEEQREAFLLRVRHGLTVEEIAAVTGVPSGRIEWWITRAYEQLRTTDAGQ